MLTRFRALIIATIAMYLAIDRCMQRYVTVIEVDVEYFIMAM